MIRVVASTIVNCPMLIRYNRKPTMDQYMKHHILHLPLMIRSFRNTIVTVSRESKLAKLVLLQKHIPIEIFDVVKPYLISRNVQEFYPNVSAQCVPHRKYLLVESKLYRHGLLNEDTIQYVRNYIEELQLIDCQLREFNYNRRIGFIKYVMELRYIFTGEKYMNTVSETEYALRYWL